MLASSSSRVDGVIGLIAFEQVDKAKTAYPDDGIGDGQTAERGEQFAGQDLGAFHRLGQQKISRPFPLFDGDQRKPVVRRLDGQADLDKEEDEAEKAQNRGEVRAVQAEGGEQLRRVVGHQLI